MLSYPEPVEKKSSISIALATREGKPLDNISHLVSGFRVGVDPDTGKALLTEIKIQENNSWSILPELLKLESFIWVKALVKSNQGLLENSGRVYRIKEFVAAISKNPLEWTVVLDHNV